MSKSTLAAANKLQFTLAKRFWLAAILTKMLIAGIGLTGVFGGPTPAHLPEILLLLAVISEALQLKSDAQKSAAEALRRALDLRDSLGIQISDATRRDIVLAVPESLKKRIVSASDLNGYFAASGVPSPTKALHNLNESAWYTRHLTRTMATLYGSIIGLMVLTSFGALLYALTSVPSLEDRLQVSRAVAAWLMLVISLSMIKNVLAYQRMAERCQKTEDACASLLRGHVSADDALRQWSEYQLSRASSPLIPDWLWWLRGTRLDAAWREAGTDSVSN